MIIISSMETEKGTGPTAVVTASNGKSCTVADVILRVLLLAASVVAVVVMVTSKQTVNVPVPNLGIAVAVPAKFSQSPAFIYFVVALSVAGLYSIITVIASFSFIGKPNVPPKLFWILAAHDVLVLGIVAAATGTAGGVAYIGLKGNSHVRWGKICNVYDKFCRHVGGSIAVSLVASVVLVLLVILNAYSLYRCIPSSS